MWQGNWRDSVWADLDKPWDILVIGGGITGAGVLALAARAGLRVLLVEANDFAFGTSSRSSKLVHGGLRYLRNRQYNVVYESVTERERLMREAPHLVNPLRFLFPGYQTDKTPYWKMGLGVMIYDLMAPKWDHDHYSAAHLRQICPQINPDGLEGGVGYYDAQVDDTRLVVRVIREAVQNGGLALNYAAATSLLKDRSGQVCGAVIEDRAAYPLAGRSAEVRARVVINATGPWSDELRANVNAQPRIRKLRGSHLILPLSRLPLKQAVTLLHPRDDRALFAIPWEGTTLVGTTDVDHAPLPGEEEPSISSSETEYLLEALRHAFPECQITENDLISTFAGLRPIIQDGAGAPSKASRKHAIWQENGLISITGGKLTIFRPMAAQTLNAASPRLPGNPTFSHKTPIFSSQPLFADTRQLSPTTWFYLSGRYGSDVAPLVEAAQTGELESISPLPNLWAEIRWAARDEGIVHLDDLLLRRVRLGLLLPNGGLDEVNRLRPIIQPEVGWSDERWQNEVTRYSLLWKAYYSPDPVRVTS